MGLTIADALARIYAAGVSLRVEGTNLKASGVPLLEAQRTWLRDHKLAVISEIETPSRCECTGVVWEYFATEDGSALNAALCERHSAERRAALAEAAA